MVATALAGLVGSLLVVARARLASLVQLVLTLACWWWHANLGASSRVHACFFGNLVVIVPCTLGLRLHSVILVAIANTRYAVCHARFHDVRNDILTDIKPWRPSYSVMFQI